MLLDQKEGRHVRAERAGEAAATGDLFLDVVVLLSVALFLMLAIGVGILVLRGAFGS